MQASTMKSALDHKLNVKNQATWSILPWLVEYYPKGYMWCGGRHTKIQATTRPENVLLEVWVKMRKAAQKKENQ